MHYIQQFQVIFCTSPDEKKEQRVELWSHGGKAYGATRRCWGGWTELKTQDIVGVDTEVAAGPFHDVHTTHWEAAGFTDVMELDRFINDKSKESIKRACDTLNRKMLL